MNKKGKIKTPTNSWNNIIEGFWNFMQSAFIFFRDVLEYIKRDHKLTILWGLYVLLLVFLIVILLLGKLSSTMQFAVTILIILVLVLLFVYTVRRPSREENGNSKLDTPDLEITEEVVSGPLKLESNGNCTRTGNICVKYIKAYRIKVKNNGKIAVENVYGIIEDLNTSKKFENRISWYAGEKDVSYTNINAGDHMFLNIYGVIIRNGELTEDITMATENGWKPCEVISTFSDLKFGIRVTAINAPSKRKIFKISRYNNLEMEFLNED